MLNRTELIGNLGHAPEIKDVNGTPLATFSIATTSKWKGKDGSKQERTEWHDIVVFGKLAEICEKYLKKGSKVYVAGELRYDKYESKEGSKMVRAKVHLSGPNSFMEMLGDGGRSSDDDDLGTRGADARSADDEVPF